MENEREFIAGVESADVERLTQLLRRPSHDEERLLRTYFGDHRYRRMHSLALRRGEFRGAAKGRGRVVVLHGIMGGELTRIPAGKSGVHFWMNLWQIAKGGFGHCRLNDDGRTEEHDIRATGILKRYYGELLLSLAQEWEVRPFWFDWRKDIRLSASALESQLRAWFNDDEPVHLVAHSMGGLVVRAFMKSYPDRWQAMKTTGAKAIMLGTPNFGSFAAAQVLAGTEDCVRLLARIDLCHSLKEFRAIAGTFPGCYQMLPWPEAMKSMKRLYQPETWRGLDHVSPRHLTAALEFQKWLGDAVDRERMVYISGCNRPTPDDIPDWDKFETADFTRVSNTDLYHFTADGDGTVPHRLGFLSEGQPIFEQVYYVDEEHGSLPVNPQVMRAIDEILASGSTSLLPMEKPAVRAAQSEDELKQQWRRTREPDERTQSVLDRIAARTRNIESPAAAPVSADERKAEGIFARSFLYAGDAATSAASPKSPLPPPTIEIGLVYGSIDQFDYENCRSSGESPVDCLAIGHYMGVKPQYAEEALDRAISRELLQLAGEDAPDVLPDRDLILTQYTERGTLQGQLGQPFLLVDPRSKADGTQRLIAIAGMGQPGGFGMPELTVMARELCWSLGQLGKRHLLTVLIGGGAGNLSPRDAIQGWLHGIAQAVAGGFERKGKRLERVTFIERDPRRLPMFDSAIESVAEMLKQSVTIRHTPLSKEILRQLFKEAKALEMKDLGRRWKQQRPAGDPIPTRISVQMADGTCLFAAITGDASIPERQIKLDERLVRCANDKLAAAVEPREQLDQGRFLERLLIPRDLRTQLATDAPLVLVVDRSTAQLHWELLAQPEPGERDLRARDDEEDNVQFKPNSFLGTARGLTRQFRTILAPPPEPPPPPRRVLRVLVVADPAADAPLPGAEQEGSEVADMFESFNAVFAQKTLNRVEVERLFGPYEATRDNVLLKLMLEPWDVLHFAGHCYFDPQNPSACGWIFGMKDREILSANELNRIDRVPKFVFSNACESGVTPDNAENRNAAMAPSFAEAFFDRGVANFVCTAWRIEDGAARRFARRFYSGLLGLEDPNNPQPEPMHVALREARRAIAAHGGRSWGAYQHYGNPNFRLFDCESFRNVR